MGLNPEKKVLAGESKNDQPQEAGESGHWFRDNILHPAENVLIQGEHTIASVVNHLTKPTIGVDLLPKVELVATSQAKMWSAEWWAQNLSSGLATAVVYAIAGKVAGGSMRLAGRSLALEGEMAGIAANENVARTVGAVAYDGLRDKNQGETRCGNMAGSLVGFGIFGAGNSLAHSSELQLAKYTTEKLGFNATGRIVTGWSSRFVIQGITGGVGSVVQANVSNEVAQGKLLSKDENYQHALEGAAMNVALPVVQEGLSRGTTDLINKHILGRGISVDRFVYNHDFEGKSPLLDILIKENPLTRVQKDNKDTFIDQDKNVIHLADMTPEKLGHELAHRKLLKESEGEFKRIAELVNGGKENEAKEAYLKLRLTHEITARTTEAQIAKELGRPQQEPDTSKLAKDEKYQKQWQDEFEKFKESRGKYRPLIDYSSEDADAPRRRFNFISSLSKGRFDCVREDIRCKLVTENDLQHVDIRNAAHSKLVECLSEGKIWDAIKVLDFELLTKDDLKHDDIRNAARSACATCLLEGELEPTDEFIDRELLTPDDLKHHVIRNAARVGCEICLSKGWISTVKGFIDRELLTLDDLKHDDFNNAARTGLVTCLSEGQIADAEKLIDLKLLTEDDLKHDDINNTARSNLVEYLSNGEIDKAKYLIDLKLLTENDLKYDDIRNAARSELAKRLSNGECYDAKHLIDLKLLAENDLKHDDIRNAVRSGLANKLSGGQINDVKGLIDLKLLSQNAIDDFFRESVLDGHITSVVRYALNNRIDLNDTLNKYLGISKLTDDTATKLYQDLKAKDNAWKDEDNIQKPFEEGAKIFGITQMLRYVFKANSTPHDALYAFHDVVQLYNHSKLTPEKFYNNILSQVNRDDALDDTGSSFSRLNTIAQGFPEDINAVLQKAKNYPEIKILQNLVVSLDQNSVFNSWAHLQRFAKLQHFTEQVELLPQIQQLRQNDQHQLADWVEALAFHPDSKVSTAAVNDFWKDPAKFLGYDDAHSQKSHALKKPSNYIDIPHLDLDAIQLRDALVGGALDKLQVFSPMRIEYNVGGNELNLVSGLKQALGSRQDNQPGKAKHPGKLFSEVNKLAKSQNITVKQILDGAELPAQLQTELESLLYNKDFGIQKPKPSGLRLVAEIHKKSSPLAVVAGDDTASCMGFGTGKNNVYMFNPNDALFTVRLVREDGTARTIAQSVLTKDKDVKISFPTILEKMQGHEKTPLHTIIPEEALRGEKTVIAADNIEVHPNYQADMYQSALEAVYRDFFTQYIQLHGNNENIRGDKLIIGLGGSDALNSLPQESNTYVPQAPVGYTDKSHETVYTLSLGQPSNIPLRVLNVEDIKVDGRIKPHGSYVPGITPLTFEDSLSLAYLEGKGYQDNPSLQEGLHQMENALIAKDINNTVKGRKNLSLKYEDNDGRMKGYLLAYEGQENYNGDMQPVIFIGDFVSDRPSGKMSAVGGKLLLEFANMYKEEYLDKGNLTPIFANTRDNTSYKLLIDQMKFLEKRFGYRMEIKEIGSYENGSSTMHDLLIVPHRQEFYTAQHEKTA